MMLHINYRPATRSLKQLFLFILIAFYGLPVKAQSPNSWSRKNDMGPAKINEVTARVEAVGFSIGNKGYLGTGFTGSVKKNDFWEFDPANNIWTQKAAFPGSPRDGAVGFSIGSKGYLGLGSDASNTRLNDFWEYNPATNNWTQKANFGGSARKGAVGFSITTKGYIGTGNDATGNKNDFWEYNPTANTWTQKAVYPGGAVTEAAGFSVNNVGYIGTGTTTKVFYQYEPFSNTWVVRAPYPGTGVTEVVGFSIGTKGYFATGKRSTGGLSGDIYEYDQSTNTWTMQSADIPQSRYGATGFSIGNRGYITTGWNSTGYRNDTWEFKPNVSQWNIWTQKAQLGNRSRKQATAFTIGNKAYVGTGYDGMYRSDFWEFDPVTDSWTQKASVPGKPRHRAFGFGIGNKGYLGGGIDTMGYLYKTFYEYDPFSNSWTEKSSIYWGSPDSYLGFSVGPKGYLYGGSSFQEYNPATDTWTLRADFPTMPRSGAVAFSIGDKGYFGLGFRNGSNMKDFWEYDPASNTWLQKANFPGTDRSNALGFELGNNGYVAMGSSTTSNLLELWEYSPNNNTWVRKADFTGSRRTGPVAFGIGSKGYVGLGADTQYNFLADLYEYTPSVPPAFKDVAVTGIKGLPTNSCGLSAQQVISVTVANLGGAPEHSIALSLSVNGVPLTPNPVIFPDTIAPNEVANLTFTTPANLSNPGNYRIKPTISLPGDNKPVNDTASFKVTNNQISGLPFFDFELSGSTQGSFRIRNNFYNFVQHTFGNGNLSSGALATTLRKIALPISTGASGNLWEVYADRIGGSYICFDPSGGSASDSLWLTFDLKQELHHDPINTNFRVTINGQQVGNTFNPPATGPANYRRYKINLYQYRTASSVEIGFESLLNRINFNNTNPINYLDNIRVVRRLAQTTGTPENRTVTGISIYPNPTASRFTIKVPGNEKPHLQVLELTGKIIKTQPLETGENQVNLPEIRKGIYLIKLTTKTGTEVRKLVLQ